MSKLTTFDRMGKALAISFIETQQVKQGVACDVYKFTDDNSCDLGVVVVKAGSKTPKQKILTGTKTIEGFINGKGSLKVIKLNGEVLEYQFPNDLVEIELHVGDIMQWSAENDLSFYEVCYPAYEDGRFLNLD